MGIITKKSYVVLDPQTSFTCELIGLGGTLYPNILPFGDNWVAVSGDNAYRFERNGTPVPNSAIPLQAAAKQFPILSMLVKDHYLLVLREGTLTVLNLLDSARVQDIDFEKGSLGRDMGINADRILVSFDVSTGVKKEMASKLAYLRTVPADEQIKALLRDGKVPEAHKVFTQNNSSTDPTYEAKRDEFSVEAGWAALVGLDFAKAAELFQAANCDPAELLALVPGLLDSKAVAYKTLKDIVGAKALPTEKAESAIQEGTNTIRLLAEGKRRWIAEHFDLAKDGKKSMQFRHPSGGINVTFRTAKPTLEEIMEVLDGAIIKLYVGQHEVKPIKSYFDSIKLMKCNYKQMENYLKEKLAADPRSCTAPICLAYLHEKYENYFAAVDVWRQFMGTAEGEDKKLACDEIVKLLVSKITDKELIFKYAGTVLAVFPEKGLRIFTVNECLPKFITEEDVIAFLGEFERYDETIKERYMEFIVGKPTTAEKYHTLLAIHYAEKIKAALKKEGHDISETASDSSVGRYRDKLDVMLRTSKMYDIEAVLKAIHGAGMFEQEILLYSRQGKHNEALDSLVEMGRKTCNFGKAEEYCLEQSVPLLGPLFEKILGLYKTSRELYLLREKDKASYDSALKAKSELEELKKKMAAYEQCCKTYLRKYADNEKLDVEFVLRVLPDEWGLRESHDGKVDESLLQFMALAINDRLGKENNIKVEQRIADMHKLNLQVELRELQRAQTTITAERKCRVCLKPLAGAKTIYVFPNGMVAHSQCVREPGVCPVTGYNFAKNASD